MKTALIVICVVVVVVLIVLMLAASHRKWLKSQTPVGVWRASTDQQAITLKFYGGPNEGPYKQLVESDEKTIREFGHWAVHLNELRMLIMATDIQDHPRSGRDTVYSIAYVGPDSIRIDGPDRPSLLYQRVANDTVPDFVKELEHPGSADSEQ